VSDSHLSCRAHVMAMVKQIRPHCVNQMGKTHSKLLAARHGRRTACVRHAMCESALKKLRRESFVKFDGQKVVLYLWK